MIQQNTKNAHLQVMDGRNRHNLVAEWMDEENVYKIYHDSTGSDRIKFEQGFDKNTFWSGRPDIIVEV